MPATTHRPKDEPYVIDEKRHSVVLTRHLAVAVEQAFAFWTEPRHVTQWWDAAGEPLVECLIDLRVGGEMRFVGARKEFPPFTGRYLQIAPPRLIVFEAMGATGTVTIQAQGKGSRIVVEIRAPSAEALQAMLNVGVAVGTAQTLNNLAAFARTAAGSAD
jgi:uncharacterized protein YndB with AHSA1/START domain